MRNVRQQSQVIPAAGAFLEVGERQRAKDSLLRLMASTGPRGWDQKVSVEKVFYVRFDGEVPVSLEEVWPDGDAPENPTAEDVVRVMESCGSRSRVLDDWSLDDSLRVLVSERWDKEVEAWALPKVAGRDG